MPKKTFCLLAFAVSVSILSADAVTRYVVLNNPNANPPFTSWATAAATIQDAVALANLNGAGDTVLVSNGHYVLTGQIYVTNCIVRSVGNDPAQVTVDGGYPTVQSRCFYLNHPGALLSGLTITNGYIENDSGGGIYVADGTVSNCVIAGNSAVQSGTGARGGGGIYLVKGALTTCRIYSNKFDNTLNSSEYSGGGGVRISSGIVSNCVVAFNALLAYPDATYNSGGGIYVSATSGGATITHCLIVSNEARQNGIGGGIGTYITNEDQLPTLISNCKIIGNTANKHGGGCYLFCTKEYLPATYRNCLIAYNTAETGHGGGINYARAAVIDNCTIVSNSAGLYGGGITAGYTAAYTGSNSVRNCIVYYNTANTAKTFNFHDPSAAGFALSAIYCCTAPGSGFIIDGGVTDPPLFVNLEEGDYRLLSDSPCINTGLVLDWMAEPGAVDLNGLSRVDRYSGLVDIGCYEYLLKGTLVGVR